MSIGRESSLEDDSSEQQSATTMTPNTQKAQDSLWVLRLRAPQQQIYQYRQDAGQEICQCKDGMKIFERSVEEQCSDVWYSDTSEEEKSDLDHGSDPQKLAEGAEDTRGTKEELQISKLDTNSTDKNMCTLGQGNNYTRASSISKSLSSSSGGSSNGKANVCAKGHKIKPRRNRSRSAFDLEELALSRPRAGSFIHQFSRQTTRQSVDNYTVGGLSNGINSEGSTADEPICLAMSRSSITAIPTHVYSLEKYISTELDSATESFFDKDVKIADISPSDGQSSIMSPSFPSSSSLSFASNSSNSNMIDKLSPPPLFLDQRKRRKSHIELSLAESFQ